MKLINLVGVSSLSRSPAWDNPRTPPPPWSHCRADTQHAISPASSPGHPPPVRGGPPLTPRLILASLCRGETETSIDFVRALCNIFFIDTPSRQIKSAEVMASLPDQKRKAFLFCKNIQDPRPTQRSRSRLQRELTGGPHGSRTSWITSQSAHGVETKPLYALD